MGGNFSGSIITEDISEHDYLKSLSEPKTFPRPKILLDFKISSELKDMRSSGHFVFTFPTSVNEDIHISWKGSVVESKYFQKILSYLPIQIK